MNLTVHEKDSKPNAGYIAFHQPRFDFMLKVLRRHVHRTAPHVLDIGRSHLTTLMCREFNTAVDSLGLEPDAELAIGRHYCFDLNETQYRDHWRTGLPPYDVVVFAEVLEHLYTAPELVLDFLCHLLKPGGLLVLQTPNAVSLGKRIKFAFGVNPFELIRRDRLNPGHYREYTLNEILHILPGSGFSVAEKHRKHYFDTRFAHHELGNEPPMIVSGTIRNVAYRLLPPPLREGITIVARRRE